MLSPPHAPNPMERVEETAHPRGKPGTPRNQTSNGLAMGHDQQSLLADSEITHSPPGPTHEILANPRFVISPRCLASLQDNLTNRRMRDPHVRWCERRAGKPGPPTRLSLNVLLIQRLEAHTAHATHVRCTGVAACACGLRLISNDCLGGQEQTSDGSRVLQRGTGDLDRIGNAEIGRAHV